MTETSYSSLAVQRQADQESLKGLKALSRSYRLAQFCHKALSPLRSSMPPAASFKKLGKFVCFFE